MAFYMKAGRGPTQRMGRSIPLNMKSPLYEVGDPDAEVLIFKKVKKLKGLLKLQQK